MIDAAVGIAVTFVSAMKGTATTLSTKYPTPWSAAIQKDISRPPIAGVAARRIISAIVTSGAQIPEYPHQSDLYDAFSHAYSYAAYICSASADSNCALEVGIGRART
jgi:hypothetical protein